MVRTGGGRLTVELRGISRKLMPIHVETDGKEFSALRTVSPVPVTQFHWIFRQKC